MFYCLKGYIFLFSRSYLNFMLNTKKINYLESFNLYIVSLLLIELENVIRLYAWELVRKKVIKNKKTNETFVFFFFLLKCMAKETVDTQPWFVGLVIASTDREDQICEVFESEWIRTHGTRKVLLEPCTFFCVRECFLFLKKKTSC